MKTLLSEFYDPSYSTGNPFIRNFQQMSANAQTLRRDSEYLNYIRYQQRQKNKLFYLFSTSFKCDDDKLSMVYDRIREYAVPGMANVDKSKGRVCLFASTSLNQSDNNYYLNKFRINDTENIEKQGITIKVMRFTDQNGKPLPDSEVALKFSNILDDPYNEQYYATDNVNEFLVGFYGTNILRKVIPNFVYIYSGKHLSTNYNNKIIQDYTSQSYLRPLQSVIFMEYVPGKTSLYDLVIKDPDPKVFLLAIIEIVAALFTAYRAIDYTHYDLHSGNVMMRPASQADRTCYLGETFSKMKIRSGLVPVIIDYGRSHAQIQALDTAGQVRMIHIGNSQETTQGIYSFVGNPLHDVIKLIGTTFSSVAYAKSYYKTTKYDAILSVCGGLLNFFGLNSNLFREDEYEKIVIGYSYSTHLSNLSREQMSKVDRVFVEYAWQLYGNKYLTSQDVSWDDSNNEREFYQLIERKKLVDDSQNKFTDIARMGIM